MYGYTTNRGCGDIAGYVVSENRHLPKLNDSNVLGNYLIVERWETKATNSLSVRVIQRHYVSVILITYQLCSENHAAATAAAAANYWNHAGHNISVLQFQHHVSYNLIFHDLFPHFTRIILLSKRDVMQERHYSYRNRTIPKTSHTKRTGESVCSVRVQQD